MKNQVIPYKDNIPGRPSIAPVSSVKIFMPTAILKGERRKSATNIPHIPTIPFKQRFAAIFSGFENTAKHI